MQKQNIQVTPAQYQTTNNGYRIGLLIKNFIKLIYRMKSHKTTWHRFLMMLNLCTVLLPRRRQSFRLCSLCDSPLNLGRSKLLLFRGLICIAEARGQHIETFNRICQKQARTQKCDRLYWHAQRQI